MVTLQDFIHALETQNLFVKDYKTHSETDYEKVLFERQHQGIRGIHSLKSLKVEGEKLSFNKKTLNGYPRTSLLLRVFNQIVAFQELFFKIML